MLIRKKECFFNLIESKFVLHTVGTVAATQHITPKFEFTNIIFHHLMTTCCEKSDSADRFYPTLRLRISPPDIKYRIFSRRRVRRYPCDVKAINTIFPLGDVRSATGSIDVCREFMY